jgi:DNA-binding NtrC family response regulator
MDTKRGKSMEKLILVVDDEEGICDSFSMALEGSKYKLVTASCFDDAVKKIKAKKPDLMFTDLKMPGKSGVELVEAILSKHPDVRVYVVTAFYEEYMEGLHRLNDAGLDFNVMRKPVGLEQIRMVVDSVFDGLQTIPSTSK